MKVLLRRLLLNSKPYLFISLVAIVAFAPVSFMIFSLKNDIVALDYPIKYFISQCVQNNIQPFWFNSWAMGFPLESIITWSFFSPLQFFFSLLFEYDLYILHVEFVSYIIFSGWSMFYFLNRHFSGEKKLNTILAMCYMLSGFMVGSSQWMTYITAAAFLPLVSACLLTLLRNPSVKSSLVFVAAFYIMLTSAYPAFTIITIYVLLICALVFLLRAWNTHWKRFVKILGFLICTLLLMTLVYSPGIISSFRVLEAIDRGSPISSFSEFFNSNYFHPRGIQTLLLPFSSTRLTAQNTEGTMLDGYMGLLPLLLLPNSIYANLKNRNIINFALLTIACGFVLLSFGPITPLRNLLNFLPGFSYFRNPALFRLFFILFILLYLSRTYQSIGLNGLLSNHELAKHFRVTVLTLLSITLLIMIFYIGVLKSFPGLATPKEFVNNLSLNDTLFISAFIQFVLLTLIYFFHKKKKIAFLNTIVISDLVINCLICTPFFTVSSYSVKEINDGIFKSTEKFPIQLTNLSDVPTSHHRNGARWYNINVYDKEVSCQPSYLGPLVLKTYHPTQETNKFSGKPLLFSFDSNVKIEVIKQQPNKVSTFVNTASATTIFFQQNFYTGWHAYLNRKEIPIEPIDGRMKVLVTGSGTLEFKYERATLYVLAIIINVITLSILGFFLFKKIGRPMRHS